MTVSTPRVADKRRKRKERAKWSLVFLAGRREVFAGVVVPDSLLPQLCTLPAAVPFEISTRDLRGSVRPDAPDNYQLKFARPYQEKLIKNKIVNVAFTGRKLPGAGRIMVHEIPPRKFNSLPFQGRHSD